MYLVDYSWWLYQQSSNMCYICWDPTFWEWEKVFTCIELVFLIWSYMPTGLYFTTWFNSSFNISLETIIKTGLKTWCRSCIVWHNTSYSPQWSLQVPFSDLLHKGIGYRVRLKFKCFQACTSERRFLWCPKNVCQIWALNVFNSSLHGGRNIWSSRRSILLVLFKLLLDLPMENVIIIIIFLIFGFWIIFSEFVIYVLLLTIDNNSNKPWDLWFYFPTYLHEGDFL